jgi:heptosyltransferase I
VAGLSPKIARPHSKWPPPTFKILFVKTSSLGDVVHNCPAVSDAAREIPGAEIDWIVEEPFAAVAAMHASVRRVIPVAVRRWRSQAWPWNEIAAWRRRLRAERYDAVVDTQGLLKSALLARCALGRHHGLDGASARERLASWFYDARHAVPRAMHAVERNRLLAAAALRYKINPSVDYGLSIGESFVAENYSVFLTMTSRADKLWPEERWVECGRALGGRVVLPWGSEAERARAQRIAASVPGAEVPARMTLEQLARLFARSRFVVGLDTGLTHLAAALGTRTVGLYTGSDPALTGIYGAPRATHLGAPGRPPTATAVLKALA